jgi:hypothetical protein
LTTDEDEDDGDFPLPREFAWSLIAATGIELVRDVATAVADACETVCHTIVAHEKWRDDNAELGRHIEALTDVTPFQ